MVGLGSTGKKRVKAFSLGMKQRLGIAMALLHKPKLLLLDEPVNGLDPAGIVEIRELLLRLQREQGITIFISSHLLSEIERTCDHIGIIHKGKMRYQGPMQELLGRPDLSREVIFHVPEAWVAAEKLKEVFPRIKAVQDRRLMLVLDDQQQVSAVTRTMLEMGIDVEGIDVKKGLEDWFMNITTQTA
jgi:ABC-2 type transport system ATP-binding protein